MSTDATTAYWQGTTERLHQQERGYYRSLDTLSLRHALACLEYEVVDPIDDTDRLLTVGSLQRAKDELRRRERLALQSPGRLDHPSMGDWPRWDAVIAEIRQRADIIHLYQELRAGGGELRRVGRDHRRPGGEEWAGPCIVCGGDDRFRVWPGPPGRYWCRQCGARGDALDLFQQYFTGAAIPFAEAVQLAARELGIVTPGAPVRTHQRPAPLGAV